MRNLLAVLLIAALVAPAMGQVKYFKDTADGSFDTYRSTSAPEGYSAGGGGSDVRLGKYNQNMGWMSFLNAQASDGSGSLAAYLTANPGKTAKLYIQLGTPFATSTLNMVSIRAGNAGAMVEDQGNGNGFGPATPDPGYTGASELQAWRGCATAPLTVFPNFGDGIYTLEDPNSTAGIQGQAWITPSTRAANAGRSPFQTGPGAMVRYDKGIWAGAAAGTTGTPTGKYLGYFADTTGGRSYYALEDVIGFYNNNARSATLADIATAGQIVNGGATPVAVGAAMSAVQVDPLYGVSGNWLVVPIDAAFLADMANPENKGFVFANNVAGLVVDYSNPNMRTKEYQGGAVQPYILVPEPATMILLALGGLVALRRRMA